jgi:hypothetical protein
VLERLLYLLADRIGALVVVNALAGEVGVSKTTVERYLNLLEGALLIHRVPAYGKSEETRQRRGRKLYFADVLVRNSVLQAPAARIFEPARQGPILENVVATHLHAFARANQARLFHHRDRKGEVDFVLERGSDSVAIEVGRSDGHDLAALVRFSASHPSFVGRTWLLSPHVPAWQPARADRPGKLPLADALLGIADATAQRIAVVAGRSARPGPSDT